MVKDKTESRGFNVFLCVVCQLFYAKSFTETYAFLSEFEQSYCKIDLKFSIGCHIGGVPSSCQRCHNSGNTTIFFKNFSRTLV